jgi:hypothetical protein
VVDNTLHRPEIKSTLRKYSPYSQEFSQIICLNSIFVIEISTVLRLYAPDKKPCVNLDDLKGLAVLSLLVAADVLLLLIIWWKIMKEE